MNNYEILLASGNKITIPSEKSFTPTILKQISQMINVSIRGNPEISIEDWIKLNESVWLDFVYASENSFHAAEAKLMEKISKDTKPSRKGFFVSCFSEEIEFQEFDSLLKNLTTKTGVNDIVWSIASPENGENPFTSFVVIK